MLGSEAEDARQFAEWEVDYVKLDGCYSNVRDMDRGKVSISFMRCKAVWPLSNAMETFQFIKGGDAKFLTSPIKKDQRAV